MNFVFILFINACLIVLSAGEQCQKLDGLWQSEYGSRLNLSHTEDGILSGQYMGSGNELCIDDGSNVQLQLTGAAVYNQSGAVFILNVMCSKGVAIKSWIGQCLICDNNAVLHTSWLLRQRAKGCSDKWMITTYGETTFTRQLDIKDKKYVNNQHYSATGNRSTRSNHDQYTTTSVNVDTTTSVNVDTTTSSPRESCSLTGYWCNELGSELFIASHQNGTIRGEYRTAVEVSSGSAGTNYSIVYGLANDLDANTTIALYVVWNNGHSVTGWVGQCQLCGRNQTETLVTTWQLRTKVNACNESWSATRIGENYFTRKQQKSCRFKQGTSTDE